MTQLMHIKQAGKDVAEDEDDDAVPAGPSLGQTKVIDRTFVLNLVFLTVLALGALLLTGILSLPTFFPSAAAPVVTQDPVNAAQPVSVIAVKSLDFRQNLLLTGSLVARRQALVSSELSGVRIVAIHADIGDWVTKGQVLAQLVTTQLEAKLAQNSAALAKADAAIAQAKSAIIQAEANASETGKALKRAKKLTRRGHLTAAVYETREAAARSAKAQLVSARDGLMLAKADKALIKAQRRELDWQLSNTQIKAPLAGIISRRNARIGAVTVSIGKPLFRLIADGEIEFEADVPQVDLVSLQAGQDATLFLQGMTPITGTVRLISPEIDRATRLGKLRIYIGVNKVLPIGAFARASVVTRQSHGLAVPLSAVLYGADGTRVQIITDGHIVSRLVTSGLTSGGQVEITHGLSIGDLVVARAGTFLREGDAVTPVLPVPPMARNPMKQGAMRLSRAQLAAQIGRATPGAIVSGTIKSDGINTATAKTALAKPQTAKVDIQALVP